MHRAFCIGQLPTPLEQASFWPARFEKVSRNDAPPSGRGPCSARRRPLICAGTPQRRRLQQGRSGRELEASSFMSVEAVLTVAALLLAVLTLIPPERGQDLCIRMGRSVRV